MKPFDASQRASNLQICQDQEIDIIVVGGGINGAGVFLESSRFGLKTLLLEKDDFASATSSASSKLIHGGLRYLEMMDWKQVFESCRDRKKLLKLAPSLVQPLEFLFPVYRNQRRRLLTIYLGTIIYYFLALLRNIGFPKKAGVKKTSQLAPKLALENLRGSVLYYDASTIDSKLTISAIKTGAQLGGYACNHAEVTDYITENGSIRGVQVTDKLSNKTYSIRSKWVVNAVGPWTDEIRSKFLKNQTLRFVSLKVFI